MVILLDWILAVFHHWGILVSSVIGACLQMIESRGKVQMRIYKLLKWPLDPRGKPLAMPWSKSLGFKLILDNAFWIGAVVLVFVGMFLAWKDQFKCSQTLARDRDAWSNRVDSITTQWKTEVVSSSTLTNDLSLKAVQAQKTAIEWSNEVVRMAKELTNGILVKTFDRIDDESFKPIASQSDLEKELIVGKTVFPPAIPPSPTFLPGVPQSVFHISGKRFVNCDIVGPAILHIQETSIRGKSVLNAPVGNSARDCLYLVQGEYTIGVVPMEHCEFETCRFIGIGFASKNANDLERLRKGFKEE